MKIKSEDYNIKYKHTLKYLRVTLDRILTYRKHLEKTKKKNILNQNKK